jgi:hypothetical protein
MSSVPLSMRLEMMFVPQAFEIPATISSVKDSGGFMAVIFDFRTLVFRRCLAFQVTVSSSSDQAAGCSGDSLFPGMGHGFAVQIDAPGKVKDPVCRGCDKGRQVNGWHFLVNRCWIVSCGPTGRSAAIIKKKSFQAC